MAYGGVGEGGQTDFRPYGQPTEGDPDRQQLFVAGGEKNADKPNAGDCGEDDVVVRGFPDFRDVGSDPENGDQTDHACFVDIVENDAPDGIEPQGTVHGGCGERGADTEEQRGRAIVDQHHVADPQGR